MLKAQVRTSPTTSNSKVSKPTSPAPIIKSKAVIWLDEVGLSPSITKCVTIEARRALLRLAVYLQHAKNQYSSLLCPEGWKTYIGREACFRANRPTIIVTKFARPNLIPSLILSPTLLSSGITIPYLRSLDVD